MALAAPVEVIMVDEQSSAAAGQQSLYPAPPPFYKLYRGDADGTAERPLPLVPPAPVTGDYQMFGEIHTIEPGNPPLQGVPLFATQRNQTINFKQELTKLNKEVLFSFHELLSFLINQPSQMSQQTANISTLLRNMHHLLNMLRPHQARATLATALQTEIKQRQDAVADLKLQMSAASHILAGLMTALEVNSQMPVEQDDMPMDDA